ncbi:hypothetical protein HOLleu_26859 [Holothuria leucospilota]|uniref:Sulfotransferase n=1 Tax=Holothuria leucospilota TaxID=206669 RepID=A0A9Q1BPN7_HOLLE|nr:hypothetical protein HOLleu_26859 [Holothuria leucospilota]
MLLTSLNRSKFEKLRAYSLEQKGTTRIATKENTSTPHTSNYVSHSVDARISDTVSTFDLPIPNLSNFLPNAYLYPQQGNPYSTSVLAFLHNPKSGGTSLRDCTLQLYPVTHKHKPIVVATQTVTEEKEKLLNRVTPTNDYYMGDAVLGICDSFWDSRPCSYFTLIREPYERAVSHYYFCKSGGPGFPPCNNTLEEFTMTLCSLFFRQMTGRVFCEENNRNESSSWRCKGQPITIDHILVEPQQRAAVLDYFLANIDKIFTVIGLTEEFETSLKLFENTFGEPFYRLCNKMHSNKGSYKNDTDRDDRKDNEEKITAKKRLMKNDQIRKCLHEDIQLYNKMYEIFQKQKRSISIV